MNEMKKHCKLQATQTSSNGGGLSLKGDVSATLIHNRLLQRYYHKHRGKNPIHKKT